MIKKRYLTLTLVLSLIGINKSYAACAQEQLDAFKLVEDQYKISVQLNQITKNYDVILYRNLNNKYTYSIDINMQTNEDIIADENTITYKNISPGEYTIEIIGLDNTCQEAYKILTIKVPRYNKYSEDPLCEDIEEFYLCQETYEKEIDRETFESRVNAYKNKKEKDNNQQQEIDTNEDNNNELLEYIQENLTQIIIITVFIILIIITTIVTIKQSRKSRRLE